MDYADLRAKALEQWAQEIEAACACVARLDALADLIKTADYSLGAKPVTALSANALVNKAVNLRNKLWRTRHE